MPLSLTVPLYETLHIGDRHIQLVSIGLHVRVRLDSGEELDLVGHAMHKVLPGVLIGINDRLSRKKVRLAIDAPKKQMIRRKEGAPSVEDL